MMNRLYFSFSTAAEMATVLDQFWHWQKNNGQPRTLVTAISIGAGLSEFRLASGIDNIQAVLLEHTLLEIIQRGGWDVTIKTKGTPALWDTPFARSLNDDAGQLLDPPPLKPEVGMGATRCFINDRYPFTVIAVSRSEKSITIQQDRCWRVDNNGLSENQAWAFESDPEGKILYCRRQPNQPERWLVIGEKSSYVILGERSAYQNPSG